jgi:RES domain-containing protein
MAKNRSESDYACPACFEYDWLKNYVKEKSTKEGTCPSCQSRRQPLIPVTALYEPFHNLISSNKRADGPPLEYGTPIVDLIQDDWEVFSERLVERGGAGALLESILYSGWDDDDGGPPLGASDPYVARHRTWSHDTLADIWEKFAERVKEAPTRELEFRDPEFDDFLVGEDLLGRRTASEPVGTVYYRARPGFVKTEDGRLEPHSGAGIGAPPPERAKAGRANPEGKVAMYCADQETTAVAEIRPARGEYVSVAEVQANKELKILDLATEPEWPNPFTDEAVNYEVEFAALLAAFAEEMEKPLRYRDDPTDYIPSQKLTDLIERAGVDGIRYPSAMFPGGTNVVLFDPKAADIGPSRLVEVTETKVSYTGFDPRFGR